MIIITGASKGIGQYLFHKYEQENIPIIGTYNSTPQNSSLKSQNLFKVDIKNYESVLLFHSKIIEQLDNLTLINCASISDSTFTHKSNPEYWKEVIETNLIGTYHMIRVFLPFMREKGFGRIVNFSSVLAQKGTIGTSAYSASKSGLWGLTKSLAVENATKGITVNNINLGYANIGMGIEKVPDKFREQIILQIPTKAFCTPEDIFKTVEYMRNTTYLNGSSIDLNGGLF